MKSNSDVKPPILQDLGDGSWHYNYHIAEVPKQTEEENAAGTVFEYDTIHIWGNPNYDAIVKAVIAMQYTPSEETSLINKYNALTLKLSIDNSDRDKYEAYLKDVANIKAMIKTDLRTLGYLEPEPVRTLEQAIAGKLAEIDEYDNSNEVNSFIFNGQKTWIDAGTRAVFRNSIDSAELLEEETIQMPIANTILTVPARDL
ncbi:MAG: hypothetical protein LBJ17_02195 [Dysgonamonadaceae bacterium]|jgi:hypothetical protein|nr:hypothetical protein [Dysgonamonadaceae bacterium]